MSSLIVKGKIGSALD